MWKEESRGKTQVHIIRLCAFAEGKSVNVNALVRVTGARAKDTTAAVVVAANAVTVDTTRLATPFFISGGVPVRRE